MFLLYIYNVLCKNNVMMHNVSDVRQIEIHIPEPLVPGPSRLELKLLLQS
jgi:hypothetical protein